MQTGRLPANVSWPASIGSQTFGGILHPIHMQSRPVASWQASLLNTMGRVVLINSVLDSQLNYLMSALSLPPGVIKQVAKQRRIFMWGGNQETSAAQCLVAWKKVCTTKELGGLGTKDLGAQNICLLLKLSHRLHTNFICLGTMGTLTSVSGHFARRSSWPALGSSSVLASSVSTNTNSEHWKRPWYFLLV